MKRRYFGTDGVRGVANQGLTPEFAFQLGQAAGAWLRESGQPPQAVMGRDTRRSGPMLGAALAAGLCSVGVDVTALGVAPTGAVSWLARTGDYGLGVVISASHNPAPDNGIKLIGHDGRKLADAQEVWIEEKIGEAPADRPVGTAVGELRSDSAALEAYLAWLETLVPERLDGVRVVVDGAHGAAYALGPEVLRRLGAEVTVTAVTPDGMNINQGSGATHPATVQAATQAAHADLGIAFDGDADRAVFSDSEGRLINGDRMMAVWCAHWRAQGALDPALVVGTVMSNGGFERYMAGQGIELHRVAVGDKYVSARLAETGGRIGGEQSGHIIFPERGPTGDGLVTALELLRVLRREGRSAASFYGDFANDPQLLVNVAVASKDGWETHEGLQGAIREAESRLAGHGRINVRASGTQPMIRVMVEADDEALRDRVTESVVTAMLGALGGGVYSRVDLTHALGD